MPHFLDQFVLLAVAVNQWMPRECISNYVMHTNFSWKIRPTDHNQASLLCQDTSPVPSLDGSAKFSPSWKLLRFGMELVITSWLAHQITVRVVRVFNVSVFTADIKAESSVKRTNQKGLDSSRNSTILQKNKRNHIAWHLVGIPLFFFAVLWLVSV